MKSAKNIFTTYLVENTDALKNHNKGIGDHFTGMLPSHVVETNQGGSETKLAIIDQQPMCHHCKESQKILIGPDIGGQTNFAHQVSSTLTANQSVFENRCQSLGLIG